MRLFFNQRVRRTEPSPPPPPAQCAKSPAFQIFPWAPLPPSPPRILQGGGEPRRGIRGREILSLPRDPFGGRFTAAKIGRKKSISLRPSASAIFWGSGTPPAGLGPHPPRPLRILHGRGRAFPRGGGSVPAKNGRREAADSAGGPSGAAL
eukprot:gene15443-biopygen12729